jgi:hypothetical protein
MKGDPCNSCGDYNGNRKGEVWVECCGRCNELQFIGRCNWCQGTGFEVENPETNFKMINDRCEEMNGYLCGYDPKAY